MSLLYRREDNGEVIELPDDTWLQQVAGAITLPDGVTAKRCVQLEIQRDGTMRRTPQKAHGVDQPILSDNLGFGAHQLPEFEADRRMNKFTGIEFVQDKDVPEFYQVKCSSRKQWKKYVEHRGWIDKTGQLGLGAGRISPAELEAARRLVVERHGAANT